MGRFRAQGAKKGRQRRPRRGRCARKGRRTGPGGRGRYAGAGWHNVHAVCFCSRCSQLDERRREAEPGQRQHQRPGGDTRAGWGCRAGRCGRCAGTGRHDLYAPCFRSRCSQLDERRRKTEPGQRQHQRPGGRSRQRPGAVLCDLHAVGAEMCTTRMLHMISHSLRSLPPIRRGGHAVQF